MVKDARDKQEMFGVSDLDPCTYAISPTSRGISRWHRAKQRFPIRTGLAAITLFTLGSVLLYVSTLFGLDGEHKGLSFFVLGLITFIPGSYATTQLYGAYKGWHGYDYSQVPSYDD
ncbi:Aste57867_8178 [Aphanomyces stellatus]|uniref:Transmembrane protein 230 n=1 Tax=Aphanomyces stellatus TaxID=120398 RepID=A0A485KJL3_9STRA|nr:hypothetical protein As57867_008147 [Aphanomyces stellatus]VFT85066.1 Aste57867_8178 [Aphanomyces stellatus]